MKKAKGFRIILISISLLTFFSPAYFCYLDLSQANLVSPDISFESPDQDGLSMNPQNESRGFAVIALSVSFVPRNDFFKWLLDFSYETLPIGQRPFVLRC